MMFISIHCVKNIRIRSYSSSYFPGFRLNMEEYGASLHIQSKCEINTDHNTQYAVFILDQKYSFLKNWSQIMKVVIRIFNLFATSFCFGKLVEIPEIASTLQSVFLINLNKTTC